MGFDVTGFRKNFPALNRKVCGNPLVYFDSAASSLTPIAVADKIRDFYLNNSANVHRGIHELSEEGTTAFEQSRAEIRTFVNAPSEQSVVLSYGCTDSINTIVNGFAASKLKSADTVLIAESEHHANIVPWQMLQKKIGFEIVKIPIDEHGRLRHEIMSEYAGKSIRFVCLASHSNATGVAHNVQEWTQWVHKQGGYLVLDAAQAVSHGAVDFKGLGVDFLSFSFHKMYGPFGVGALISKEEHLSDFVPVRGGGEMIDSVRFSGTTFAKPPQLLEAGTPNVAGVIGAGESIRFIRGFDSKELASHESSLAKMCREGVQSIEGVELLGNEDPQNAPLVSFAVKKCHPHDLSTLLNGYGIAVRAGHHCAQPVMDRYGFSGTIRASFLAYNTHDEVSYFVEKLKTSIKMLRDA